jgi:hypothetical protein
MEENIKEIITFDDYKITFFDKAKWWMKDARFYPRNFIIGVKNLFKWAPVIWKDRSWDHFFIYQIIELKLREQAKYIGTKNRHTRAQEDARDMLICANLISKVKDGYYDGEYMDYHKSELHFLPIEDKPGFRELKVNITSEDFESYFKKYPSWKKRAIRYIKENKQRFTTDHTDNQLVAMIMGDLRQEKAKDLIFKLMSNKINSWWD